ncbi:NUDIX domain-containing protein [Actinophytocola algeriensis]|uniref:Nudix hydrolase domain-containing protein n=1 Tax=Actinophytocola algeriensis TaxID=1768010 RepID=A0A7W7VEW5_9PSEU|nr:NUDIX domain-containing protein [Actinophytocola algeriensis]MBB4907559.1 hypothetical protein [Actinophytocola algeriensis]MBE1479589.1 hypothetical protein [Actinophytocola algeriensis]
MTFPVSIKGVVIHADKVLLLRNDRDEWELPGGRLEIGETPEECGAPSRLHRHVPLHDERPGRRSTRRQTRSWKGKSQP